MPEKAQGIKNVLRLIIIGVLLINHVIGLSMHVLAHTQLFMKIQEYIPVAYIFIIPIPAMVGIIFNEKLFHAADHPSQGRVDLNVENIPKWVNNYLKACFFYFVVLIVISFFVESHVSRHLDRFGYEVFSLMSAVFSLLSLCYFWNQLLVERNTGR